MSNKDKWNSFYVGVKNDNPIAYGNDDITYRKGYEWLKDCEVIEDWGCGFGFFGTFCKPDQYRPLDGSKTPFAVEIVDLEWYQSSPEGIFMRHILEHNVEWRRILRNALISFSKRMVLVLFTPIVEKTYDWSPDAEYRNYFFKTNDITDIIENFKDVKYHLERDIQTSTQFGVEHIFYLERA